MEKNERERDEGKDSGSGFFFFFALPNWFGASFFISSALRYGIINYWRRPVLSILDLADKIHPSSSGVENNGRTVVSDVSKQREQKYLLIDRRWPHNLIQTRLTITATSIEHRIFQFFLLQSCHLSSWLRQTESIRHGCQCGRFLRHHRYDHRRMMLSISTSAYTCLPERRTHSWRRFRNVVLFIQQFPYALLWIFIFSSLALV